MDNKTEGTYDKQIMIIRRYKSLLFCRSRFCSRSFFPSRSFFRGRGLFGRRCISWGCLSRSTFTLCRSSLSRGFLFISFFFLFLIRFSRNNFWSLSWNSKKFFQFIILVCNIKVIIVSTVFIPIEQLWWQRVSLTLFLLCACPHRVSLVVHSRS